MASQTEPAHDPKSSSDYIQFECLPPGGALNRWSARLTKDHDFPGAQVRYNTLYGSNYMYWCGWQIKAMLYGAGVPDRETMKNAPQVGIASVWWEGNPCKYADSQLI